MNQGQVEPNNQSLVDHLTELRTRLVWSIVAIFVGFLVCWVFSDLLFDIVRRPIAPYLKSTTGGLVFTAPMDKFLAHIKVSLLGGAILACPFWMFQLWKFVAPGLYDKERKYAVSFIGFGTVLFLTGVSFVYFVVYPMAFKFLMTFGGETDAPMITIGEYLSFFVTTTLVFGVAFEMPVILAILGMMGIVSGDFLARYRRYAYVLLAAMSAIFTPPDVLSMLFMMGPMLLLYEISVLLVKMLAQNQDSQNS
ncbi:MAG: twin-arginine translocase subunit TatC [Bdellovibrionaceae bacterium]|nr:twin-arginine translocase subunit TatC [Bdellovibrionales bacterium]MCB9085496.1 twin-arginine translocase subunit TatC [Pseudobdellovibrionaceae bacterium]